MNRSTDAKLCDSNETFIFVGRKVHHENRSYRKKIATVLFPGMVGGVFLADLTLASETWSQSN